MSMISLRSHPNCAVGSADNLDQIRKAKAEAAKQEKAREIVDSFKPIEREFQKADGTSADCARAEEGKVVLSGHRRRGAIELWAARALAVGSLGLTGLVDHLLFSPNDKITGVTHKGEQGELRSLEAEAQELSTLTFGGDFTPEYTKTFKMSSEDDGSRIYKYEFDNLSQVEKYTVKEKDGKLEMVDAQYLHEARWHNKF